MSSLKYIEIDSTYRNRNLWPKASDFDVIISQNGANNQINAVDPVCLSAPEKTWSGIYFNANGGGSSIIVKSDLSSTNIGNSSDLVTFIIQGTVTDVLQTENGYYNGAIIKIDSIAGTEKRIVTYEYIGNNRARITVSSSYGSVLTNNLDLIITDPSDISDVNSPWFFVPNGKLGNNSYAGYLLYNETNNEYRVINNYDSITHVFTTTEPIPLSWSLSDNYTIRKQYPFLITTPLTGTVQAVTISNGSTQNNYYKGMFLRLRSAVYGNGIIAPGNESRRIVSYDGVTKQAILEKPFTASPVGFIGEILIFSYDNFNPFVYTGSTVSQQEMVCYEIELISLILPNVTLKGGFGSRIAFYPYVYVELTNLSSSRSGLNNIIYSNNPHSTKMLFRAPVDDIQNPLLSSFVKIDGDGTVQTIKFKPNDNLHFSVHLSNGELYETIIEENFSPLAPNPLVQISAMFSIKRV